MERTGLSNTRRTSQTSSDLPSAPEEEGKGYSAAGEPVNPLKRRRVVTACTNCRTRKSKVITRVSNVKAGSADIRLLTSAFQSFLDPIFLLPLRGLRSAMAPSRPAARAQNWGICVRTRVTYLLGDRP